MRRRYGHGPLHLLGHLALIVLAGFALAQLFGMDVAPQPLNLALWLALGALVHDLVLLPAYSLADRAIRRLPAPLVNHVRFPLAVSGLLLLVWFPLILERQPGNYVNALGREPPDFLARWIAVTASLLGLSAVAYVLRRAGGRARGARPPRSAPTASPAGGRDGGRS
jgi:hypothetical protein